MAFFARSSSGSVQIVATAGGVQMVTMVRSKKEYFKDFIVREAKAQGLKVVINGSFVNLSFSSGVSVRLGSDPLDPSDSKVIGKVIQDGKLIAGGSESGRFYFSQNSCDVEAFSVGLDDPPATSCAAIGGIAPIVSKGIPYGTANLYRAGVPNGAPITGDVAAKYLPFLTQKSNAMYRDILNRGESVGKTAIGYSSSKGALLILSQEDGTTGLNADGFRRVFYRTKSKTRCSSIAVIPRRSTTTESLLLSLERIRTSF